jgi:UDP-N-acetylglucosamine/UDP-N-acetylgalactosamine diphosphorylase
VSIPNPYSLDIGEEVDVARFSGKEVTLFPGCRIYGSRTVISAGVELGREGPVTLDNCQLGSGVRLKAGYFMGSVFLEKASMGLGAHVREGCILEEEANGAHCVGLKQTILFPFVTLGSLINFCDCLMAGGSSRKNHSEVGSSYIHFNFTPEGNKTTPSLFGEVARGVMLNQPPIFLGGQGGLVGPLRLGFGNVVAAGTILRKDMTEDNKLIAGNTQAEKVIDYRPGFYPNLPHILVNNIYYLGNLTALEQWYQHVRRVFFERQEFGLLIHAGAVGNLAGAKEERLKQLQSMADQILKKAGDKALKSDKRQFCDKMAEIKKIFLEEIETSEIALARERFLEVLLQTPRAKKSYLEAIQGLPEETAGWGVQWLQSVVDESVKRAAGILSEFRLVKKLSTSPSKHRR